MELVSVSFLFHGLGISTKHSRPGQRITWTFSPVGLGTNVVKRSTTHQHAAISEPRWHVTRSAVPVDVLGQKPTVQAEMQVWAWSLLLGSLWPLLAPVET